MCAAAALTASAVPARLLLDGDHHVAVQRRLEPALGRVDDHDLAGAGLPRGRDRPGDHRPPAQRVQQLLHRGAHASPLPRGKDDDDGRGHGGIVGDTEVSVELAVRRPPPSLCPASLARVARTSGSTCARRCQTPRTCGRPRLKLVAPDLGHQLLVRRALHLAPLRLRAPAVPLLCTPQACEQYRCVAVLRHELVAAVQAGSRGDVEPVLAAAVRVERRRAVRADDPQVLEPVVGRASR